MATAHPTPTIDLIHEHGSVRKFRAEPVPGVLVEQIVSTRPNAHPLLPTSRCGALCGDDHGTAQGPVRSGGPGACCSGAGCACLVRGPRSPGSGLRTGGYQQVSEYVENFLLAAVDAASASQTAALAAESLGLGIYCIGALRNDPGRVVDLLGLPRLVFPLVGMTMGYPDGQPRFGRGCRWPRCCTGTRMTGRRRMPACTRMTAR